MLFKNILKYYILYNVNKQKGLVKLQDVIFESLNILVVVALCESSIYLYNFYNWGLKGQAECRERKRVICMHI